ncbi:hypothetical protein KBC70_01400 [Candidatus Woesebacteria bacterium]|jgi:hypothetical protein|nr:hypothetical protein [Candidatus Woesebacteria bacterium]
MDQTTPLQVLFLTLLSAFCAGLLMITSYTVYAITARVVLEQIWGYTEVGWNAAVLFGFIPMCFAIRDIGEEEYHKSILKYLMNRLFWIPVKIMGTAVGFATLLSLFHDMF